GTTRLEMELAATTQKLRPGVGAERESGAMVSSWQTRAKMGSSRNKTMQLPRPRDQLI
uniref:Uncharacterized protein n=1 Tax=Aegilops tauschii subsp. strangulata TaxID=200361 RepID=A0A453HK77_AEGTS